MNGLDERIHDLLKDAERSESKEETIHMLAEEKPPEISILQVTIC